MNQIPNIEEVVTEIEAILDPYDTEIWQHPHRLQAKVVEFVRNTHHQQLQKTRERTVIEEDLIEIAEMIANGNAFDKESGLIWQHVIDEAKRLCLLRDAVEAVNHSELDQPTNLKINNNMQLQPKSNEEIVEEFGNHLYNGYDIFAKRHLLSVLAQKDKEVAEERINTLKEVEVLISRGNDPQWAINHLKTHKLLTPKE